MRKHRSSTASLVDLVARKARELCDARYDAATAEYAEILMHWRDVDFNDLDRRISEAKAGGLPPLSKWRARFNEEKEVTTVDQVPEAKGNFRW